MCVFCIHVCVRMCQSLTEYILCVCNTSINACMHSYARDSMTSFDNLMCLILEYKVEKRRLECQYNDNSRALLRLQNLLATLIQQSRTTTISPNIYSNTEINVVENATTFSNEEGSKAAKENSPNAESLEARMEELTTEMRRIEREQTDFKRKISECDEKIKELTHMFKGW